VERGVGKVDRNFYLMFGGAFVAPFASISFKLKPRDS